MNQLTRWAGAAGAYLVVVVLLFVAAAGEGVRGSDQYWYLTDVETLIRDGAVTSNTIFPVGLLGPGGTLTPPFIHNVLGTYLAAVPALVLGGYGGWIAFNVLATLATAALIFLAARTVADRWAALLCAVLYPLLPITLWHATQPLTEPSTALFAALAMFVLSIAGSSAVRWLGVVGAVGLVYYTRESYLPLLIGVPVAFVLVRTTEGPGRVGRLRQALLPMTGLCAGVAVVLIVGRLLFGAQNVHFSYGRLLNSAVPGVTDNMWFNFDLSVANLADRLPFRLDLLGTKLIANLAQQFGAFESLPFAIFFWTFNLLAVIAVVTMWRDRHRPDRLRLIIAALAFVAIHLLTITLFQNQVRYTVPAIPGLLIVLAIALSGIPALARLAAPTKLALVVLVTLVAIPPALVMIRAQRADAAGYGAAERAVRTLLDVHLTPTDRAVIVYVGQPQVLGYAAGRRPILFVSPGYSEEEYRRLRQSFSTRWVLAPVGSPAIAGLGAGLTAPIGLVDYAGVAWGLYLLPD